MMGGQKRGLGGTGTEWEGQRARSEAERAGVGRLNELRPEKKTEGRRKGLTYPQKKKARKIRRGGGPPDGKGGAVKRPFLGKKGIGQKHGDNAGTPSRGGNQEAK